MTQPIKQVAIAINCFRPGGGMESYTFDLVRGFSAHHTDITIYASQIDQSVPEYQKITACHVNQKYTLKKLRPFFFTKKLAEFRRTDIPLIACNPSDHADVFVCGGTHLGYLYNMHRKANLLDKLVIRRNHSNYKSAHTIMAHSGLMQQELVEFYGVAPEKIQLIYPPADMARFYPSSDKTQATREKYGFKDHETIFLFPSTGHKRKGLDLLAHFFESTDLPIKLAVAGSPLPRPIKNVVELGFCKDIPDLYRATDFTIMASLYEPFGLVGIESILCGTKVVFSNNMGCTEVMNQNAGFFFSRQQPETLYQAITQAVVAKQNGTHKITNPLDTLTYNPSLEHHIQKLYQMLKVV